MTIQEAFEEMKRRYPGEDIRASCMMDNFRGGMTRRHYEVYRSKGDPTHGNGNTWKEALDDLTPTSSDIEPCDDGDLLDYENQEDAVRTAAEIRKEMREGGKI